MNSSDLKNPIKSNIELDLLQVEPTRLCNLNCKTCTHDKNIHNGQLNISTLIDIITQFSYINTIKLQGLGEPLLNPNIDNLIRIASYHADNVTLITNGIIPFHDLPKETTSICVSLNTLNGDTYKHLTGMSLSYIPQVLENIYKALKYNKTVELNCVLSQFNSPSEVEEIKSFAKKLNLTLHLTDQQIWVGKDHPEYRNALISVMKSRYNHNVTNVKNTAETCPWTLNQLYYDYKGRLHPCCIRMTDEYIINDITEFDYINCCTNCPL